MSRHRQTASLLSVSEVTVATTLSADAAAGATTLYVDDVSVFDESGWLKVGSQVTKYTAIDDDAGTITIPSPGLTAAADTDDVVARWSKLYDDVDTVLMAQVAVLGSRDQADELTVEVADWLDLPTGDRGGDGENCTIESDGDVWTLIHAGGRPTKARGWKWFWEPPYVLTAADITAGSATIPLKYRPDPTSTELWWRRVLQDYGTDFTVNETAQTITLPLGSFAAAGDPVPIHYRYRTGLAKPAAPVNFTRVGSTVNHGVNWTSVPWPAGAQPTDVFVFAQLAPTAAINTCTDSRAIFVASGTLSDPAGNESTGKIWTGNVGNTATPLAASATDLGGVQEDDYVLFVFRPDAPISVDLARVSDSGAQGPGQIPGLPGSGSGAIGVGFSAAGIGGTAPHTWATPWAFVPVPGDTDGVYRRISVAMQTNPVVGATPAITSDAWRGFALGLTEG